VKRGKEEEKRNIAKDWLLMPIILAIWEAKIGRIEVPALAKSENLSQHNQSKKTWSCASSDSICPSSTKS
jgi:hypothetical protein